MLVLLERNHEIAQHRLKVRSKLRARIFFKRCECATAGFLHTLVVVKDHTEKLTGGCQILPCKRVIPRDEGDTYTLKRGNEELVTMVVRDGLGAPARISAKRPASN